MTNTFFSNQSDRRSFLRFLERVLKRLTDVETNGYSPPTLDAASSMGDNEEDDSIDASTSAQQESAASRKRKKKKKKKQQQAQQKAAAEGSKAVNGASAPQLTPMVEEKKEDPLVTALKGMGFTEDQIGAAVKACGGTNRATADDLVTWILGQDADGNIDGGNDDIGNGSTQQEEVVEVVPEPVVKARTLFDEAKRAEAEARAEAARLEQEEASRRLAAKREEQRRRNREWNNREQARQQEAAKVKMAQAIAPRPTMPTGPAYGAAHPSLQTQGLHTGIPALNGGVGLNTGYSSVPQTMSTGAPMSAQPMQNSSASSNLMHSVNHQPGPMGLNPMYEAPSNVAAGSQFSSFNQAGYPMEARKAPPSGPSGSYVFAPSGDDDRTVSSFGSNPGLSVSSNSFGPPSMTQNNAAAPIPPPGFKAPMPATMVKPPMQAQLNLPPSVPNANYPVGLTAEPNNLGEIRATAKAFVPTGFTPTATANNTTLPPLSGDFGEPQSTNLTQLASEPNTMGSFDNSSAFPPGLLQSGLGGPPGPPGLSSNIPSLASTSTGSPVAGLEESALSGLSLGFGMDTKANSGPSSLLDSFANNGQSASSIWGGPQGVSSLGGLPAYSMGESNRNGSGESQSNFDPQAPRWGGGEYKSSSSRRTGVNLVMGSSVRTLGGTISLLSKSQ